MQKERDGGWDAMKPSERRSAFIGDLVVAFGGAGLLYWLFL